MDPYSVLAGGPSYSFQDDDLSRAGATQYVTMSSPFVFGGGSASAAGQTVASLTPIIIIGALAWMAARYLAK